MLLTSIRLTNFKNHFQNQFDIENQFVALLGANGSGKTNFLDALHHISFGRSLFHKQDAFQISHGQSFYRLDAQLKDLNHHHRLELVYQEGEKKNMVWDGAKVERQLDHVGRIPLVYILPNETFQMHEGSEWRRNFFDNTFSQTFPDYLRHLAAYKKALAQRNATLQYFFERRISDFTLLDAIDHQLITNSSVLDETRRIHTPKMELLVKEYYAKLSDDAEEVGLIRKTDLDEGTMEEWLHKNRSRDLDQQRTISGLHKDDFLFSQGEHALKKVGSQGQQKSFLLALKLAQYEFIKMETGKNPWMLLDDIFDKLDEARIARLVEIIAKPDMGQVFLTDARPDRSQSILGKDFQVLMIQQASL